MYEQLIYFYTNVDLCVRVYYLFVRFIYRFTKKCNILVSYDGMGGGMSSSPMMRVVLSVMRFLLFHKSTFYYTIFSIFKKIWSKVETRPYLDIVMYRDHTVSLTKKNLNRNHSFIRETKNFYRELMCNEC